MEKCGMNSNHASITFSEDGMFLCRLSLSCDALYHPTSLDRNPFEHGVWTVLSAAPERAERWRMVPRYTGLLSVLNGVKEPFSSEGTTINLLHPLCEEKVDFKEWRRLRSGIHQCIVSYAATKPNFVNVQTTKSTFKKCRICSHGCNYETQ